MISSSGKACLADFGLASIRDSNIRHFTSASKARPVGTTRWQAPELIDCDSPFADDFGVNTLASDIWAFSCVCYEVSTSLQIKFLAARYSRSGRSSRTTCLFTS